jgi:DNA-binding PadR family transcriptional regulator
LNLNNWQTQLRKGLLDVVILNFLNHGRYHGYEMVQKLNKSKDYRFAKVISIPFWPDCKPMVW